MRGGPRSGTTWGEYYGEDIREGITAAVNLFIHEPQFQGQTKDKLNNPSVRGMVSSCVRPALEQWLHQNKTCRSDCHPRDSIGSSTDGQPLCGRGCSQEVTGQPSLESSRQTGGLLQYGPVQSELFLVEGDSAGGSAKQGRDRHTQAILSGERS